MAERRSRPEASSEQVRVFMSRQRTSNTGPEVALRRALHARGLRYRLHRRDLPGRPDIALAKVRLAVFVDGCFWHACPEHGVRPKSNAAWWEAKLTATADRDRRNDERLAALGWHAMHVWEHEDVSVVADRIAALWFEGRG